MTSKAEFMSKWSENTAQERRARLNQLGAVEVKTDDEKREHDALAEMVAADEEAALRAQGTEDGE